MSDTKKQGGEKDTYDLLHRQFNLFGGDAPVQPEEEDVKNSGEIYFSASPDIPFGEGGAASGDIDWSRFEESAARESKSGGRSARKEPRKNAPPGTGRSASGGKTEEKAKPVQRAKPGSGAKAPAKKSGSAKPEKGGSRATGAILAMLMLIIVVAVSLILRVPIMGCINDIIAIDRSTTEIRVVIDKNMNTNDVIDLLANAGTSAILQTITGA